MTFDFDLFVIGAGSGGVRAARISAQHGARVAVAEEYRVGGTCVIRGCVPKKMLVYGAHFAEDLHEAASFGWDIEGARFNWPRLRDLVQKDVERLEGLYTQGLDNNRVEILKSGQPLPDRILFGWRVGGKSAHEPFLLRQAHGPRARMCPERNSALHRTRYSTWRRFLAGPSLRGLAILPMSSPASFMRSESM
jgi:hypothetical protein